MYENLEKLIETVRILRSPQGCEWDRAQTHKSLKPNMLEEAYETVDAIDSGDIANLREELGDVLLQVLLHSQIADDEGEFNLDDVAKELNEKLIHRHPHVFGNTKVSSTQDILDNWDKLKKEEKKAEQEKDFNHMEEEYGDILFAIVNLARWNKIDAEQALLKANKKFMARFRKMEELAEKPLTDYDFREYDKLWKQAKKAVDRKN